MVVFYDGWGVVGCFFLRVLWAVAVWALVIAVRLGGAGRRFYEGIGARGIFAGSAKIFGADLKNQST